MDVRIIGGGPAGSAAAIRLARQGCRVTLYEKAAFPRAKLCGGFISGEALPELMDLDVADLLERSGAWPIHRLVISAASGAQADVALPRPGLGNFTANIGCASARNRPETSQNHDPS